MRGVAAGAPVDGLADGGEPALEAEAALFGVLVEAGLVLVELVAAAVFGVRDVRHDHVRPREHALFATVVRERLERRGGGDVHVVQEEARRGDHVEAEAEMICGVVGREGDVAPERRVVVRDVRSHADHVEVQIPEEQDVPGEVVERLPRQAAHDAAADLVAAFPQQAQAVDAALEAVVRRVELRVELGAGGLDAQQIAVRARGAPAGVGLLRLLAQRKRDADRAPAEFVDLAEDAFDEGGVLLGGDFARLEDERAIAQIDVSAHGAQDGLLVEFEAADAVVALADAAVVAVLGADVAHFDDPAQAHEPA